MYGHDCYSNSTHIGYGFYSPWIHIQGSLELKMLKTSSASMYSESVKKEFYLARVVFTNYNSQAYIITKSNRVKFYSNNYFTKSILLNNTKILKSL